jgi:drug/metabolite transporter (DMT)-like permease
VNPEFPVTDPEAHEAAVHETEEGKSRAMLIGLILLSVLLAALAQVTLKFGMNKVTARSGTAGLNAASLKAMVTTPAVIGGLVIFGFSAVIWLLVLSRASLSFAYPFASLSYLLIVLADRFFLHEQIPPLRWAGVFFIMVGIVLVAQTPHN